jgi:hypothetical protein
VRNAHRARAIPRLSRRNVLLGAATVGVGGAVVSVANLSEAFEGADAASDEAIVVHVKDLKAGRLDIFAGDQRIEVRDRDLAARLAKAARKKK